jgi:hypothetical protein
VTEGQHKFPCAKCGGDAEYVPRVGLKCPFCSHTQGEPQNPDQVIEEFDFATYLSRAKRGYAVEKSQSVACRECGASSTYAGDTASAKCGFCGSPVVLEGASDDVVRPEAVVPFIVTKEEAVRRFKTWVEGLWFAPNELKRLAEHDRIQGVYRPYWTFDSATHSWYTGERGEHYWDTEYYTDAQGRRQSRQVRKTRWYPASGQVSGFFDDVLVTAGRPTQWETTWKLKEAKPYDPGFLAGWSAERYVVPPEKAWPTAKKEIDAGIYRMVCRDIGGDEQRVHSIRTSYNAIRFKHLLLPLYLSSYFYQGKPFQFQVNGQTGEVKGQRPWSFWKIFLLILAILAAIGAIVGAFAIADASKKRHRPPPERVEVEGFGWRCRPPLTGPPSAVSGRPSAGQYLMPTSMKKPSSLRSAAVSSASVLSSVTSMRNQRWPMPA